MGLRIVFFLVLGYNLSRSIEGVPCLGHYLFILSTTTHFIIN